MSVNDDTTVVQKTDKGRGRAERGGMRASERESGG